MWCIWGIGEVYTGFWWGNLRERGHFKGLGILILIKMDLQEMGWRHGLE